MNKYIGYLTMYSLNNNGELYTEKEVNDILSNALKMSNFILIKATIKKIYDDSKQYYIECIVEYPNEIILSGHNRDFYLNGIKTFDFEDNNNCLCEFTIEQIINL